MEPSPELIGEIFKGRIHRARRIPPGDKALSGPELFDHVCELMDSGIRSQFPNADEVEVRRIRRQRLVIAKWMDESD